MSHRQGGEEESDFRDLGALKMSRFGCFTSATVCAGFMERKKKKTKPHSESMNGLTAGEDAQIRSVNLV